MKKFLKKEMSAEEYKALQKEQIDELNEKVVKFIKENAFDNYFNLLDVLSHFYKYSMHNAVLIASQNKFARHVGSFQFWKKMNRSVKKGEKGIKILVPVHKCVYYDEVNQKYLKREEYESLSQEEKDLIFIKKILGFKVGNVFDITQTDGSDEITEPLKPYSLNGEVKLFNELIKKLRQVVPNYEVRFEEKSSDYQQVRGYCNPSKKEIVVFQDTEHQMVKTLVHEIAHALLHENSKLKSQDQEIQAESVAYMVMQNIGLPSDDYSIRYLSSWCGRKEDGNIKDHLMDGFDAIMKATKAIMSVLENNGGNNVIIA